MVLVNNKIKIKTLREINLTRRDTLLIALLIGKIIVQINRSIKHWNYWNLSLLLNANISSMVVARSLPYSFRFKWRDDSQWHFKSTAWLQEIVETRSGMNKVKVKYLIRYHFWYHVSDLESGLCDRMRKILIFWLVFWNLSYVRTL